MGALAVPTEREVSEAIELAKEVIAAIDADEESWFDRLLDSTPVFSPSDLRTYSDANRQAIIVMMQELVRSRSIVLAARAEPRINLACSPTLRNAVDEYEDK